MIHDAPSEIEMLEMPADPWRLAQTPGDEDALTRDLLHERGPVTNPLEDRPVHIRVTPYGIQLAFFHASRPLPPFQLTIPHGQWAQIVQLIAETAPRVPGFEAFIGFTPESLALHQIDAVELAVGIAQ